MLNWSWSLAAVLALTALAGAVGGVVHELLTTRGRTDGALELPHRLRRFHKLDLGMAAPVIVGSVTAMALLYFVSPGETLTTVAAGGETVTATRYDLIRVIALGLLAGSAGASLLTSLQTGLQNRVAAVVAENDLTRAQAVFTTELERTGSDTLSTVRAAVDRAVTAASAEVQAVIRRTADQLPPALAEVAGEHPDAVRARINLIETTAGAAAPEKEADAVAARLDAIVADVEAEITAALADRAEHARHLVDASTGHRRP